MSTGEFGAYDVIWIEANDCEQSIDIQQAARETQTTWGPAVNGRIAFISGDLDYHVKRGDGRSREFVGRMVNYLTIGGGTALMLNTGCTARAGSAIARNVSDWQPALGAALNDGADRSDYNPSVINAAHPLVSDGTSTGIDSSPAFTAGDFAWGNTCHGSIGSYPDDYESVFGRGTDHCMIARASKMLDRDEDGFSVEDDCDDGDATVYPGAEEVCDGADNDCDGVVDAPGLEGGSLWYPDADGDGYGDENADPIESCLPPDGYVDNNIDCDDDDPDAYPGADGFDDDCDPFDGGSDDADTATYGDGVDTGADKLPGGECGCANGSMNSGSMWLAILAMVGLARRRHS